MVAGIIRRKVRYAVRSACRDVSFGLAEEKLWLQSVSSAAWRQQAEESETCAAREDRQDIDVHRDPG